MEQSPAMLGLAQQGPLLLSGFSGCGVMHTLTSDTLGNLFL